ncbi:MAG: Gfo/Idh/MocA family protein [Candidatus Cyclobacteriaceae bacterium M3_2C_046]
MNRRKFIERSALGTAALAGSFYRPGKAQNRKIKIGLIGSGWYGMVLMKAALNAGGVEVIGLCDVDSQHLKESADEIEKLSGQTPKTFKNYQDLLDMQGLEAVFIGTPPHWHALQFNAACEKGLDIYCEKPLSYDVREGMSMVEAAQKAGNIVQIGFQRRQSDAFKKAMEYVQSGKAGDIHQVEAQIFYAANIKDTTIQDPPASLDWDMWCGPAPKLPYRPSIGHLSWRLEKAYGNGHLVDWGIHHIDVIRRNLNLGLPESLHTFGGIYHLQDQITTPDTLTAQLNYQEVPVVWQHRLWGPGAFDKQANNGILFHGDKATVFAADHKMVVIPSDKDAERQEMDIRTDKMQEKHVAEFLNAVRNQDPNQISCTTEDGFQSTASVQLAMTSYYSGDQVKYNPDTHQITNNAKAVDLLKRDYRGTYKHPYTYS